MIRSRWLSCGIPLCVGSLTIVLSMTRCIHIHLISNVLCSCCVTPVRIIQGVDLLPLRSKRRLHQECSNLIPVRHGTILGKQDVGRIASTQQRQMDTAFRSRAENSTRWTSEWSRCSLPFPCVVTPRKGNQRGTRLNVYGTKCVAA